MRIDHVQITAPRDRETEIRHFYEGVLGLRTRNRLRTIPSGGIWFDMDGGSELHVILEDNPYRPPAGDHFAVAVDDIERVKARLARHSLGYRRSGTGEADRIFVDDPVGNRIEFVAAPEKPSSKRRWWWPRA